MQKYSPRYCCPFSSLSILSPLFHQHISVVRLVPLKAYSAGACIASLIDVDFCAAHVCRAGLFTIFIILYYVYIYVFIYVFMYVWMYGCMCVCVYVDVYVCGATHICIFLSI